MPSRDSASWASIGLEGLRAAYRSMRDGKTGASHASSRDDTVAAAASEARAEKAPEGNKIVECPTCTAPSIVRYNGDTLPGVGFCGHEVLFKMVDIMCARGHHFDAMDETNSVHAPDELCEKVPHVQEH